MKKIIPFKKDIIFKTNVSEITSISLEHTLSKTEENSIHGDFTVSGEYKIADESIHTEKFSYELPFDIHMDERYDLDNIVIDVDDFYYEIVNNNVLSVNIDVLIDKLEEKLLPEVEKVEEVIPIEPVTTEQDRVFTLDEIPKEELPTECIEEENVQEEVVESRCIEPEDIEQPRKDMEIPSEITTVFDNMDASSETYKSYKVYIVREGDDLEFIMEKYATTKETIEQYNDLKELKIGDKIIIPSLNENT